jgi:hypothetical protein
MGMSDRWYPKVRQNAEFTFVTAHASSFTAIGTGDASRTARRHTSNSDMVVLG